MAKDTVPSAPVRKSSRSLQSLEGLISANDLSISTALGIIQRQITSLEERSRNADDRIDAALKNISELDASLGTLSQRLASAGDSFAKLRDDLIERIDTYNAAAGTAHSRLNNYVEKAEEAKAKRHLALDKKIQGMEQHHLELAKNVTKWINRGIGGWVTVVVVAGIMQMLVMSVINENDAQHAMMHKKDTMSIERLEGCERAMGQLFREMTRKHPASPPKQPPAPPPRSP